MCPSALKSHSDKIGEAVLHVTTKRLVFEVAPTTKGLVSEDAPAI
jgi:hypothetical protein